MPATHELKSVELVISTAESLKKSAEILAAVANNMQSSGLTHAYFLWTHQQTKCLQVVTLLAKACEDAIDAQVLAKNQHRPSRFEIMKTRSARDVATRRLRQADQPRRPRGRPKKSLA